MNYCIKEVNTGEVEMRYLTFGTGDRTLAIIPGVSVKSVLDSAEQIEQAYSLLSKDFTVYLFDRRSNMPASYGISQMAEDTIKVFEKLELQNICLFGTSQGGMIAMQIALKRPKLIKKLALASTSARITHTDSNLLKKWSALAASGNARELFLEFGEAVYPNSVFSLYKDFLISQSETASEEELRRFATLTSGMEGFDVLDKLNSITCPLLLTGAEDDKVLRIESTQRIIEELGDKPNFQYFIYPPGYGHACYDTAPDFKKRLLSFLNMP